jgi:hypothetical protein
MCTKDIPKRFWWWCITLRITGFLLSLRLALFDRPNKVGVSHHSPEDGNRSSFRMSQSFVYQMMDEVQKPSNPQWTKEFLTPVLFLIFSEVCEMMLRLSLVTLGFSKRGSFFHSVLPYISWVTCSEFHKCFNIPFLQNHQSKTYKVPLLEKFSKSLMLSSSTFRVLFNIHREQKHYLF